MVLKVLIALAGLMGAAGVALWSAAAHIAPGANLDTASHMLIFHASATVATAVAMHTGMLRPGLAQFAAQGFVLGAALFAADLAFRAFHGTPFLFRMAAPTGGGIVIASWILLTLSALFAPGKSR